MTGYSIDSSFLSTLSLRRATGEGCNGFLVGPISIHALLAESDHKHGQLQQGHVISIHALLAESDVFAVKRYIVRQFQFLSTLSLRRATSACSLGCWLHCNFYPRSPCGERRGPDGTCRPDHPFLSTLSLRRATGGSLSDVGNGILFLSTLSLRRATILITGPPYLHYNFYPRSPCGERHIRANFCLLVYYFYPRSPCGERHTEVGIPNTNTSISIHALLAQSNDLYSTLVDITFPCIFPRTTCGERQFDKINNDAGSYISIHALLAESDDHGVTLVPHQQNFYPRSPCGERHGGDVHVYNPTDHFYPRSPCGERQLFKSPLALT